MDGYNFVQVISLIVEILSYITQDNIVKNSRSTKDVKNHIHYTYARNTRQNIRRKTFSQCVCICYTTNTHIKCNKRVAAAAAVQERLTNHLSRVDLSDSRQLRTHTHSLTNVYERVYVLKKTHYRVCRAF